jgi:hypothetical protein
MENFNQLLVQFVSHPGNAVFFLVWAVFWKGSALWKAAGKKQVIWFIVLLLINTLGLLEIAYIFYLSRWDLGSGKLLTFWEKKTQKSKTPSSKRKR